MPTFSIRSAAQVAIASILVSAAPAAAASEVGVAIDVAQPGFYGRIRIGDLPPPVVVYPEPVIVEPMPVAVVRQPVYLRVPPGHARHWARHCHRYAACGQPTYFVQDEWYQRVYLPAHAVRTEGIRRDRGHGHGRAHGHGHGRGGRDD
ncbi:MAG: hypothetical protein AB7P21_21210 [Lautropia sp.]